MDLADGSRGGSICNEILTVSTESQEVSLKSGDRLESCILRRGYGQGYYGMFLPPLTLHAVLTVTDEYDRS